MPPTPTPTPAITGTETAVALRGADSSDILPSGESASALTTSTTGAAGVVAAFTRSLAMQGSLLLTGLAKGMLKWWFRVPVKLFRPAVVNPYLVLNHMAVRDGHGRVDVRYMRRLVKTHGAAAVVKNTAPLLLVNSLVGAFLFNAYSGACAGLRALTLPLQAELDPDGCEFSPDWVPFAAGLIAGAAQSVFSTPIDNLQRSAHTHLYSDSNHHNNNSHGQHQHPGTRNSGIVGSVFMQALRSMGIPTLHDQQQQQQQQFHQQQQLLNQRQDNSHHNHTPSKGPRRLHERVHAARHVIAPYRPLYDNFRLNCLKDSLGFALFFGLFENTRDAGKALVARIQQLRQQNDEDVVQSNPIMKGVTLTGPQALAVVAAGGFAGMGFQFVNYPVDRIASESQGRGGEKETVQAIVKRLGIRGLYSGIGGQFARVVPASSAALFVYELVNEYLG
ncbi:hypothetical protein HDU83_005581 [Entophlyctis luteolus]|nr:hypothetical protein HDU83_005581 [Entophlyctis luteolus]